MTITSKSALSKLISAHFALFGATEYMNEAITQIKQTFGEFADAAIKFVGSYRARFTYAGNAQIYTAAIAHLANLITDKVIEGGLKQRVPMLPELQKAVEKRGYSFTLLRGTSYLCEVQISPK